MLGQKAADPWPEQTRHAPHGAEQTGDARTLFQRIDVAQDGLRDRQHAARAEALEEPKRDQLLHRLGLATEH